MPKKKRRRNPRSLVPFAVLGGAVVGGMVLYRRHHDDIDGESLWLAGDEYQSAASPAPNLLPPAPIAGVPLATLPPEPVPPAPDSISVRWGLSATQTHDYHLDRPVTTKPHHLGDLMHPSTALLFAQWNEVLIEIRWYAMPYRLGQTYATKYGRPPDGAWYFLGGGGSVPISTDIAGGHEYLWIALEVVQGNLVLASGRIGEVFTPELSGFLRVQ